MQLSDAFLTEEEAIETLTRELEDQGFSPEEVAGIMHAVDKDLWSDSEMDHMDGESMGPDDFSDDAEALASAGHGSDEDYGGGYADDFPMDENDMNRVSEQFNLNNGYDDINFASGKDYFPDGADSPVTDATGPSGARQGDNPEQKKMQVKETHSELVYKYRDFLKESARK